MKPRTIITIAGKNEPKTLPISTRYLLAFKPQKLITVANQKATKITTFI